ncbi:MAG: ribosomal L7Ae/L30e/S12e/Gadd45 family protein [Clostridia bacterium]|nr:ribosomal L7Ae/L30e/S12e/Gadd45 family protein [Clostridia bacterium]
MADNTRNGIRIPEDPGEAAALLAALQKKKKLAGLLGIAKKAGRVIAGTNLVTDAVRSGSPSKCPHAVFLASDVSGNTRKRITNCCTYYEIPLYDIPLTVAEVGDAIGKSGSTSAVGITDAGLADALVKLI